MIKNKEKGFTLVELLAVIAVLGLILIIAIPKVMDTLNTQKKRTLELTTRSIIKAAEEKYLENTSYGINEEITCESVSNITSNDFQSCKIVFDEVGNATVTLIGKVRYDGLNVCKATKTNAIAQNDSCQEEVTAASYLEELLSQEETLNNGLVQTSVEYNGTTYDAGIRYVGAMDDVNNQVYYNCEDTDSNGVSYGAENYDYASSREVWRIIGVFDTKSSTTGTAEKRIKLINTVSTFTASWDSSASDVNGGFGINQWGESGDYLGADLMRLLNGYYIGEDTSCAYCNGSYQSTCSQTCDAESLTSANMKPLTSVAKNMIQNAVWDTYAVSGALYPIESSDASTAYLQERGISSQYTGSSECVISGVDHCNDSIERTTSWIGLVGLMLVSDIAYANGWLYNDSIYPWSISRDLGSSGPYIVWSSASLIADQDAASSVYGV